MSRYTSYLKRKENASPYASQAVCRKCKYAEPAKTAWFCVGFGKPRKISWDILDKPGYCTEYYTKERSEKGFSITVIAREMCKITEMIGKDKPKEEE